MGSGRYPSRELAYCTERQFPLVKDNDQNVIFGWRQKPNDKMCTFPSCRAPPGSPSWPPPRSPPPPTPPPCSRQPPSLTTLEVLYEQVFLWASCPYVCSNAVQTRTESKTGLKVSLHFSRSLLYRFSLFRSLLAGLGLDKHFQTLQTLQQHVFLRFSALRVVRLLGDILLLLGFEPPLHLLVTRFLGDTGGQLHRAGQSGIGSRRRSGRCST